MKLKNEIGFEQKKMILDCEIHEQAYSYILPFVQALHDFMFYPNSIKINYIFQADQSPPPTLILQNRTHLDLRLNLLVPKLPSYIKDKAHFLRK